MSVNPVNNFNVSFGEKTKKINPLLPLSAGGLVVGAALGKLTGIKAESNNVDSFLKTVEEKLPMSFDNKSDFNNLKDKYTALKATADKRLTELGITKETQTISTNDLLNRIIHPDQPKKNLEGLQDEIKWVQGEANDLKGKADKALEYSKKLAIIKEKQKVKELVEKATDGTISASKLREFYNSDIINNAEIKDGVKNFDRIVKKFNKQRLILLAVLGTAVGATLGQYLKSHKK